MESISWHPIKGYKGYYISLCGRIKSIDRVIKTKSGKTCFIKGRDITVRKNNFGYLDTRLYKNGKKTSAFIHRLLAMTFIPNPLNKKYVNHINGIKADNRIENLEWASASENSKHAHAMGLSKNPWHCHREVIDTCTNQFFKSIKEAADAIGIPYGQCKNELYGIKKSTTCLKFAA